MSFGQRNRSIGAAAKSQVKQVQACRSSIQELLVIKCSELKWHAYYGNPPFKNNFPLFCLGLHIQVVTNCQNTVQGFKRFHGRAFADPYVQSVKSNLVYNLAQMPSGSTGIKVRILQFLVVVALQVKQVTSSIGREKRNNLLFLIHRMKPVNCS